MNVLIAKWRDEAERCEVAFKDKGLEPWTRENNAGQAAALMICADELEAALQQQGEAVAWSAGYAAGVNDERTSDANIGIAGFGAKVEPARQNPYLTNPPKPVVSDERDAEKPAASNEVIHALDNLLDVIENYMECEEGGRLGEAVRIANAALGVKS